MSIDPSRNGGPQKKSTRDHGWVVAACAVAFASAVPGGSSVAGAVAETSLSAPAVASTPASTSLETDDGAVRHLTRYCTASWRNAGVHPQEWEDCTQQVVVELFELVPRAEWQVAIEQPESEARRELNRAIWRIAQRVRRQKPAAPLVDEWAVASSPTAARELWHQVDLAARACLTPRQQVILELSRDGWKVAEIAAELRVTPERVSDEKYKAISRLRAAVGEQV